MLHTVIDATTGRVALEGATDSHAAMNWTQATRALRAENMGLVQMREVLDIVATRVYDMGKGMTPEADVAAQFSPYLDTAINALESLEYDLLQTPEEDEADRRNDEANEANEANEARFMPLGE